MGVCVARIGLGGGMCGEVWTRCGLCGEVWTRWGLHGEVWRRRGFAWRDVDKVGVCVAKRDKVRVIVGEVCIKSVYVPPSGICRVYVQRGRQSRLCVT